MTPTSTLTPGPAATPTPTFVSEILPTVVPPRATPGTSGLPSAGAGGPGSAGGYVLLTLLAAAGTALLIVGYRHAQQSAFVPASPFFAPAPRTLPVWRPAAGETFTPAALFDGVKASGLSVRGRFFAAALHRRARIAGMFGRADDRAGGPLDTSAAESLPPLVEPPSFTTRRGRR